ncbi:MAG: outer membrane protein assembly factor [Magnetococcales bacterium]|nr:outer membrane protein assembly factor [Magnetococcales bacterium]
MDKLLKYTVRFVGLEEHAELAELVKEISVGARRQGDPIGSRFLLARRGGTDQKAFLDALKAKGHFDATVNVEITGEEGEVHELVFHIAPHTRYLLAPPALIIEPAAERFTPPAWEKLKLAEGEPAESERILKAEEILRQSALEQGHPFAKTGKRRVRLDRERHLAKVELRLEPGPWVELGEVRIKGNEKVEEAFLQRRIPWSAGTPYHPKRLEELRKAMTTTGLFSVARVKLADQADGSGHWPVELEVTERKHRTWRAGAAFSTDRGMVMNGGWEHRNLGNAGERLRAEATVGMANLSLLGSYDIPDFARRGQRLRFSGKLDQAKEQAYENVSMELGAGVSRPVFEPGGEVSLTLNYRLSNVVELSTDIRKSYSYASLPLGLTLDRGNDPLDATQGWRFSSELAPMLTMTGQGVTHVRWNNRGSLYHTPEGLPRLVLAGRAELDSIHGAERDAIPADNRLYAGGGSSLRGYGQQLASPLDPTGKPLGGRSLVAFGGEARYRMNDSFGVVGFLDAGSALLAEWPWQGLHLLYGAGLGVRYMTAIGPLRLDVAAPLSRREGIDAAYQLYMSIGQAF